MKTSTKRGLRTPGSILFLLIAFAAYGPIQAATRPVLGTYYFEGWSEDNTFHLTSLLRNEYSNRKPVWGWLNDSLSKMEHQIDLAADNGIEYFAFCWYWSNDKGPINIPAILKNRINNGLALYMKARNRNRIKFCLLVANHSGYEITGTQNWKSGVDFWMPYLKDPQYLKTEGKPVLFFFNGGDSLGFDYLQQTAKQAGLPGVATTNADWQNGISNIFGYRSSYNTCTGGGLGLVEKSYASLIACTEGTWKGSSRQPYIPIIMAGWDTRPWYPMAPHSYYYTGRTPKLLATHVQNAVNWMDKHPDLVTPEHIAIIYAWNEYGEGGYLVPNQEDPNGEYLKAIKSVVGVTVNTRRKSPIIPVRNFGMHYDLAGRKLGLKSQWQMISHIHSQ